MSFMLRVLDLFTDHSAPAGGAVNTLFPHPQRKSVVLLSRLTHLVEAIHEDFHTLKRKNILGQLTHGCLIPS